MKHAKLLKSLSIANIVVFATMLLIVAVCLLLSKPPLALQHHLARVSVLTLNACYTLLGLGFLCYLIKTKGIALRISKMSCLCLLPLFVLAFFLVSLVAPQTNRIFYDEHIYQSIAQSIAETGHALLCNVCEAEGGEFKPLVQSYNKQPIGHPYYLSLFFRVFGVSEHSAHAANILAYLLGILFVYAAAFFLLNSETAALFAGLFYALTPMLVLWSATTAAEPTAACTSALAVFAAALYLREANIPTLLLFGASSSLAVYQRPESILMLPVLSVLLLLNRPQELMTPRFYLLALLTILLISPEILHLITVSGENWGASGEMFSRAAFIDNFKVNGLFYLSNIRFPLSFTIFAIIGSLFGGKLKIKLPLLLWFMFSFGVFLPFYAGSYDYGADVRFSVLTAAPLAILAGWGVRVSCSWLSSKVSPRAVLAFLAGVIFLSWIKFIPLVSSIGLEAKQAREDVECSRRFAEALPENSLVLTHNPNIWLLWGRNAAQLSLAREAKHRVHGKFFTQYPGGVYFHLNFWCQVPDPLQNSLCEDAFSYYETTLFSECKPGETRYALYRLSAKND